MYELCFTSALCWGCVCALSHVPRDDWLAQRGGLAQGEPHLLHL